MSMRSQASSNYWSDSKQVFFTPKLSLEGKNLFPNIGDAVNVHLHTRETPFLNILKKPIMSLYERLPLRSEKKPVCIVGTPKEVEVRHIKTGSLKRSNKSGESTTQPSQMESTILPQRREANLSNFNLLVKAKCSPSIRNLVPDVKNDGLHYYLLGEGNNAELIEKMLERREGWFPTNNSIFHFRWQQARPKYQSGCPPHRQVFNHLPNHEAISDKGNLLLNLKEYCLKSQEYMYRIVPVSFYLDFSSHESTEEQLKHFVQYYWECINQSEVLSQSVSPFTGIGKDKVSPLKGRSIGLDEDFQVTLQSPKKNKKEGFRSNTLRGIKNKSELNNYDFLKKKEEIRNYYKSLVTSLKPLFNFQDMGSPKRQSPFINPVPDEVFKGSLWLLKPSDLNRGRGIKLFETVEQLGQLLKQELTRNEKGSFIIQKYLQRPMLIEERKFDIRVWALLNHNKELFFFREGYVRLSGQKFSLDSRSLFTHLTNNAVQKRAANYGQFQQGNILPISFLYKNNFITKQSLFSQIKQHIMTSMRAGAPRLHIPGDKNQSILVSGAKTGQNKNKYFQIFGYDFMIDSTGHLWLIQVNTNPCIELSNKWLSMIIPRMLDDAFKLTLDRIFFKKNTFKSGAEAFEVDGYSNDENMWQPLDVENPENLATN